MPGLCSGHSDCCESVHQVALVKQAVTVLRVTSVAVLQVTPEAQCYTTRQCSKQKQSRNSHSWQSKSHQ